MKNSDPTSATPTSEPATSPPDSNYRPATTVVCEGPPSNPLAAVEAQRNKTMQQLARRQRAAHVERNKTYFTLVVQTTDGAPTTDLAALERQLADLGIGYERFRRDVELLVRHRDARRRADLGPANEVLKAANERLAAADEQHREAMKGVAAAEALQTEARGAVNAALYQQEQAVATRRQLQDIELQLAACGFPEFRGLQQKLEQEAREQEATRVRAHRAMLTEDERRREAEHRFMLRHQREIAGPGNWIERSDPNDAARELRAGSNPENVVEPAS